MDNKITLITPPDFFENGNFSILLIGLTDEDQNTVSAWLAERKFKFDINIYFYNGEQNMEWLLYAIARSDAKFLNFNSENAIINFIGSYILGRSDCYYTTEDTNLKALMSYINNLFVPNVTTFFEKVFDEHG
jgi:hypothetical protein